MTDKEREPIIDIPEVEPPLERKWTMADLGRALTAHASKDKTAWLSIHRQVEDLRESVQLQMSDMKEMLAHQNKVLIIGNGELSIRDQTRNNTRWISLANKLIFAVVIAMIGQTVAMGCGLFLAVIILLSKFNLLP